MNWKRGFRRIKQVLAVVGAFLGLFIGGKMAAGFAEGEDTIVDVHIVVALSAIFCAAICYGLTCLVYEFLEWLVLGFCDNKPKDEQK